MHTLRGSERNAGASEEVAKHIAQLFEVRSDREINGPMAIAGTQIGGTYHVEGLCKAYVRAM